MPKRFLKKILPNDKIIKDHKHIQRFGDRLNNPNLWHINRHSIARAAAIGVFSAFLPIPFQMLIAAGLAIALRANIIFSVMSVWVSNPLTIPPLLYLGYRVGILILPHSSSPVLTRSESSWEMLISGQLWAPLVCGLFILGICFSATAYLLVHLIWRIYIGYKWKKRKSRRSGLDNHH